MDKYIKESDLFKRILNVDFKHDYDGCIKFCQSIPAADVVEKEKYDRLLENALIVSSALQKYQKSDLVEVVRCRECVMWDGSFTLNGQKKCLNMTFCTDGDFYCGWGARK